MVPAFDVRFRGFRGCRGCRGLSIRRLLAATIVTCAAVTGVTGVAQAQPLRPQPPSLPVPPLPTPGSPPAAPPSDAESSESSAAPAAQAPGYLGLVADTALGMPGVEVLSVTPGGPASVGQLRAGDVMVRGNKQPLTNVNDLGELMATVFAGDKVVFEIRRDGRLLKLAVTLSARPANNDEVHDPPPAAIAGQALLGVRAATVDAVVAARLGLPVMAGARVEQVVAGSPAAASRIPVGVVIVQVDDTPIRSADDLREVIRGKQPAEVVNLRLWENTRLRSYFVRLAGTDDSEAPRPQELFRPAPAQPGTETAESVLRKQDAVAELKAIRDEIQRLERRARELEQQLK